MPCAMNTILFEPAPTHSGILFLDRLGQCPQTRIIVGVVAGIHIQPLRYLLVAMRLIQVAVHIFEMLAKELFVHAFRQNMDPEVASVQFNGRKSGPCGGTVRSVKQFAANLFVQVSRILNGIVQGELFQTVESLSRRHFLEV